MLNYIANQTAITLFSDKPYTIQHTDSRFENLLKAIKEEALDTIHDILHPYNDLKPYIKGSITIVDDVLYYDDAPLHGTLVQRILKMRREGFSINPMLLFLMNLMKNPSSRALLQLYEFLDNNNLPITDDGCFIAYKRINENWNDVYSNSIANTIGTTVSMPRNLVNDNPNDTCSHGLHVCSLEYLKSYCGARLVAVKVNPKDVVSVPIDYNNSKMRVCEYLVLKELNLEEILEIDKNWESVISISEEDDLVDDEDLEDTDDLVDDEDLEDTDDLVTSDDLEDTDEIVDDTLLFTMP